MSKHVDVAIKMAEQQKERELTTKLGARMQASAKDTGQIDSLRSTISSHVAVENYDRALRALEEFVESKHEYPQFRIRSARYIQHAIDLINAVKAKRSFPGFQHLAMSKQQELYDRAMQHFEELKGVLKRIEQIEREVRLDDVRSTVWVVKAGIFSIFAILIAGIMLEISQGVLPAATILVDSYFGQMVDFIFDKIGF